MTVGELRAKLETYEEGLDVRVGVMGLMGGLMQRLMDDRGEVLDVDSLAEEACVVLAVGQEG